MPGGDVLILKGREVQRLLAGRERELIETVRLAYEAHARGNTSVPHSTFLTFPDNATNRIIALPAYLGEEFDSAGIKWVASFPGNLDAGIERASAVVILNSMRTGRPLAILEGGIINAKRTAASAALAALHLNEGAAVRTIGVIGCGVVNFEVTRFLLAAFPSTRRLSLFDRVTSRAIEFKRRAAVLGDIDVTVAGDVAEVLRSTTLTSIATTSPEPHIFDLSACPPGTTILHVSLRDLSARAMLACDNVVDDVEHVFRSQTSLHLAEQLVFHRDFVRCTLGDILIGAAPPRESSDGVSVFSPFGLGILDIAVARMVLTLAQRAKVGLVIDGFLDHDLEVEGGSLPLAGTPFPLREGGFNRSVQHRVVPTPSRVSDRGLGPGGASPASGVVVGSSERRRTPDSRGRGG